MQVVTEAYQRRLRAYRNVRETLREELPEWSDRQVREFRDSYAGAVREGWDGGGQLDGVLRTLEAELLSRQG